MHEVPAIPVFNAESTFVPEPRRACSLPRETFNEAGSDCSLRIQYDPSAGWRVVSSVSSAHTSYSARLCPRNEQMATDNLQRKCPSCIDRQLASCDDPNIWNCSDCGGAFVKEADIPADFEVSQNESPSFSCPGCHQDMELLRCGEVEIRRCHQCKAVWLDSVAASHISQPESASISRALLYSLSLPERTLRSVVGIAAGTVREAAEFVVPQAFKNAKTYEVLVKNSLAFLTDKVGGVKSKNDDSEDSAVGDDFVARKAVGNFVDLAGLATLHVSPVWIMAIMSDVAYGTKSYVQELATELKAKGLINESSTINNVDDVLNAVQDASGNAASLFDTPPLSVDELRSTLAKTKDAIANADLKSMLPESEVNSYWTEMKDIAKRDDVSLLGVSGALTMHTLGKVKTASHGTLTGVQVIGGIFKREVLDYYGTALRDVSEKGMFQSLRETSAPYVEALWNNFSDDRSTLTDEVVSGRLFGRAISKVGGWFKGGK